MGVQADEWQAFGAWLEDQLADPAVRADWYADALPRAMALALIRHRSEHGLTQTQLGRILGLDQSQVSRLECAEHVPSFDTLLRIADALGLAIDISIRPKADARRPAPRAAVGAIVETTDQLVIEVRPAGV
ncbi:MAG: helix-turn-helix transcriptional regulator [Actinomycetota bacterium]